MKYILIAVIKIYKFNFKLKLIISKFYHEFNQSSVSSESSSTYTLGFLSFIYAYSKSSNSYTWFSYLSKNMNLFVSNPFSSVVKSISYIFRISKWIQSCTSFFDLNFTLSSSCVVCFKYASNGLIFLVQSS